MTEYVISLRNGLQNGRKPLRTLLAAERLHVIEALPTGNTVVVSVEGELDAESLQAKIGAECYVIVRARGKVL
ncbi:hypothetical protein ABIF93_005789 [Bradyrhizobium japonicum]